MDYSPTTLSTMSLAARTAVLAARFTTNDADFDKNSNQAQNQYNTVKKTANTVMIVAIVVPIVFVILFAALVVFILLRMRKRNARKEADTRAGQMMLQERLDRERLIAGDGAVYGGQGYGQQPVYGVTEADGAMKHVSEVDGGGKREISEVDGAQKHEVDGSPRRFEV
jgi:flagellar biosynthesis/type III secretory pathway M-ring protein FliF/YscJ